MTVYINSRLTEVHYCYLVALLVKHLFTQMCLYSFASTFSLKESELNRFHLCAFECEASASQLLEIERAKGREREEMVCSTNYCCTYWIRTQTISLGFGCSGKPKRKGKS